METTPSPDGFTERQTAPGEGKRQGGAVPWRHFALNIFAPSVLTFVLFLVLIFAFILPSTRRIIVDRKKEMLRELVQTAWGEVEGLYRREQDGTMTRAAAQQAAIARIREMRYGADRKDYFWISDLAPRMVMHPYRPDLDGTDLANYSDPAGKRLFVEFADMVRRHGSGYLDYLWQWMDDDRRVVPKLSFVKGFMPWGWVVGTGIYLEDVRAEIRRVTVRVLAVSLGISLLVAGLLGYIARQGLLLERRRSEAEASLRESEEKYRLLVEGATEGILMVMHGRPVYANRTLLQLLGCTAGEFLERPLAEWLSPVPGESAGADPGTETRSARLTTKSGAVIEVLAASQPVTLGERTGTIVALKDVTAHQRREQTLARVIAELQDMAQLPARPVRSLPLLRTDGALDMPVRRAAAAMARAGASAILVRSPTGDPVGIVTDSDLRTRLLGAAADADLTLASIMSSPLIRIPDRALLLEAAQMMHERRVQHLVVTDERGGTAGILPARELLQVQQHSVGLLIRAIRAATAPEDMRAAREKLIVLVRSLLEGGARVEAVTRMMTGVADAIVGRLIETALAELGPPPVPFAFMVLGSEAREEQTLATDQDNAILYEDTAPERDAEIRAYFLRLADRVCAGLDTAGYRRCNGEVMACNPKWCQSFTGWTGIFDGYIRTPDPQDILEASIFFDFRCAWGSAELVARLRRHLHEALDQQHVFFFHLAQGSLQFRPPVSIFGHLQVDASSDHPSTFNIKSAIFPLVNFARLYALRHRFEETNTLERFRRMRDADLLVPSSHDELTEAYTVLMTMRLRHQAAQAARGEAPDNHLDPRELTSIERTLLKNVFEEMGVFRARLRADFARGA